MSCYVPRPGSLPDRVIDWLTANPDEALGIDDVAAKFDANRHSVHSQLARAVADNALSRELDEDGVWLYRLPRPNGKAAPAPAPTSTFGAHNPFGQASRPASAPANPRARSRRRPALIDIAAIPVEDHVPMPGRAAGRSQVWIDKLESMQPGQSFSVPRSTMSSVHKAARTLKREGIAEYVQRTDPDGSARIWRVR